MGPYEVGRELGRGGMGVVYEGRAGDGRRVAIKVLLPGAESERFAREARLLASLGEADGFVPLLDAGVGPRGCYLVMPFVGGGTLRARLARGPLAVEEARALGRALAGALGRAHARGVVHRDVKPENVLFTEDGRPLIADLGLAKHFDAGGPGASQTVGLSRSGELRGTVGYAAPEQLADAKSAGPPADVFALGAVLYECLAGVPAFAGSTVAEALSRTVEGHVEPLRRHRPDVPRWLQAVIARALARAPERRHADGATLALALEGPPASRAGAFAVAAAITVIALAVAVATRGTGAAPGPVAPAPPAPAPGAAGEYAGFSSRRFELRRVCGSSRWKVEDSVHDLALLPGGRRALLAMRGAIALLDVTSGEVAWARRAHAARDVAAVALSPDGARGFSAGKDRTIRVWDLETRRLLATFEHPSEALALAVTEEGRTLLAAGSDGTARVVDPGTGKVFLKLRIHRKAMTSLALADRSSACSVGADGALVEWSLDGVTPPRTIATVESALARVLALPGGRLATAGLDGFLRIWTREGAPGTAIRADPGGIRCVAASPDGKLLATGGADGVVRTFDVATGAQRGRHEGSRGEVTRVAWVDETRLVAAGADARVRVFDVATGTALAATEGHDGPIVGVALLDGDRALTGSGDGTLRTWDLADGRETGRLETGGPILCLGAARDGSTVVTGHDGAARSWDANARAARGSFGHGGHRVLAVALSADRHVAVTGGSDGDATLWNLDGGTRILKLTEPSKDVRAVVLTEDAKRVYAAGMDATIRTWALDGSGPVMSLAWGSAVHVLDVPPGGRTLLVGDADGTLGVVGRAQLLVQGRFRAHAGPVAAIATTRDGRVAVTAGFDGTVALWDAERGVELDRLDLGPSCDRANAVALSPAGERLLVGTARGVLLDYRRRP